MNAPIDFHRQAWIARASLAVTLACFLYIGGYLIHRVIFTFTHEHYRSFVETLAFAGAMTVIVYSNLLYHVCLIGHYVRQANYRPTPQDVLESIYDTKAPALTVLVPSYKEERRVIWQTLVSAALSEYPTKNVVLLIDNPPQSRQPEDIALLESARAIPNDLQQWFDVPRQKMLAAQEHFANSALIDGAAHQAILASLYDESAEFLWAMARDFSHSYPPESLPFAEKFFVESILLTQAASHAERADELRHGPRLSHQLLARQYARLVGLFTINFSSFERKKYANLSDESNKAMNLNSYIMLVGKRWKEVATEKGLYLLPAAEHEAGFDIPAADYINTIDADSVMTNDYALRLIHLMEQPHNARIAVAQSPCSAYPGCTNPIERIAGAGIDVQFHTHQGYTHWDASFWVGANAMLRHVALEEIKEHHVQNSKEVTIYIQDRTVIEDTESTIDLVAKGWKLYNYPTRMTFSSTPPDFGSLIIQRRRWANGGLIILPKLLGYLKRSKWDLRLAKEMFMRINYLALTSLSCGVMLMLFFYPFEDRLMTPGLVYSSLPILFLYARDLKLTGYLYSDVWRMMALNLMLFPVILGGVIKQFQQMLTGKKIPFGRTPKVSDRTAAPAFYCILELGLAANFLMMSAHYALADHWAQFTFAMINALLFLYALFVYIGPRAVFDDILLGVSTAAKHLRAKSKRLKSAPDDNVLEATPTP